MSAEKNGRTSPTYTFQIPVYNFVAMQIGEAASDPLQLWTIERRIEFPAHQTYQLQAIDSSILFYILLHIPILHPPRHHAKLVQFWRHTFDGQDVLMFHLLTNYNLLAVSLERIAGQPSTQLRMKKLRTLLIASSASSMVTRSFLTANIRPRFLSVYSQTSPNPPLPIASLLAVPTSV